MLTLTELQEKLKREEECSLLEILNLTSEDILDRFYDKVEERYEQLAKEFDDTEEEQEEMEDR